MSSARAEIDSDRIATIWLDAPGKRVNTLSRQMWADLSAAIDQIDRERPVGVIITSAKSNTFIVGADLFEIRDMSDAEFDAYIKTGQEILARLENLPMPTLAAINGDCLGGGLELALACTARISAEYGQSIGLPEIKLGLIPGWGGTVRLPRLIGAAAIDLIFDAKLLGPASARVAGILLSIDFDPDHLLDGARRLLSEIIAHPAIFQVPSRSLDPLLTELNFKKSEPATSAQRTLLHVFEQGFLHGPQAGFDAERKAISELRKTPESQKAMQQFFDKRSQKPQ